MCGAVDSGEACLAALAGGGSNWSCWNLAAGPRRHDALPRIQEIAFFERPVVVMISGHEYRGGRKGD